MAGHGVAGRDFAHRHRLRAHGLGERAAAAQPAAAWDIDRARHLIGSVSGARTTSGSGINGEGSHTRWAYSIVKRVADVGPTLSQMAT